MSSASFIIFLFFLVSFQYAVAGDQPPQFVEKKVVTVNFTNANTIDNTNMTGNWKFQQLGVGNDTDTVNTDPISANFPLDWQEVYAPTLVFSWTVWGDASASPLHMRLNRTNSAELTNKSVDFNVSTTELDTTQTLSFEIGDLRFVFTVNVVQTLLECPNRMATSNTCISTFEPPETDCYQQISSSSGNLRPNCGVGCPDTNLTRPNTTTNQCMMAQCAARKPNTDITNVCGPACYRQINSSTGVLSEITCALSCPDTLLTQQHSILGICEMKDCGYREPNTDLKNPCGRGCYKQINSATGAEEANCRTNCIDWKLTRANTNTGKCVMKTCATRTPNVDVTPPCGALCELLSNLTCEGIGGSDVDEGEGGEDVPVVDETPQTEAVAEEDPWKNVKTALAIALPIAAVIAVLSLVICIVLVVLNAPKEEKKTNFDTTVEDGQEPVFPWKGKSPAPTPSPVNDGKDTNPAIPAGTNTAVSSTPFTAGKTTPADTSTTPTVTASRKSARKSRKSTRTKSKRLADQEDD